MNAIFNLNFYELVEVEMMRAKAKYGDYHNSHEISAVLREEYEEWWDHVKANTDDKGLYELIQVAAVALRYVIQKGNLEELQKNQRERWSIDGNVL